MSDEHLYGSPSSLLESARADGQQAIGDLLQYYRPYLYLLARIKSNQMLQSKVSDSDLVQETCLSAFRDFADFRGVTEPELTAWLRKIMAHVAANYQRDFLRQRRDVRLERQLASQLNESSRALEHALIDPKPSPSQMAIHRERAVILANALDKLPPDYRNVLIMRELQGMSLAEVAEKTERTANAAQKIWARAVVQLQSLMRAELPKS